MPLTITTAQLEEIAMAVDGDARTGYSGRCMFGAECAGVVHDGSAVALGIAIAQVITDDRLVEVMAEGAATDSMGRQTITYWPGVKVAD